MVVGTCHFVSKKDACRYYHEQGFTLLDIMNKELTGEFVIGKPTVKDGERLVVIKGEGRYGIETKD